MRIENEFNISDFVYLKTDPDQQERIITGINVRPGGRIIYAVTLGHEETCHYGFELSHEKDMLKVVK